MSLELHSAEADGQIVVSLKGRIDYANSNKFIEMLEPYILRCKADDACVIIDMGQVDYISSAGLRSLMITTRRAKMQGGKIGVAALQPVVQEVFAVSKFHLVLPCFNDVDTAKQSLQNSIS